jgi:hypothetical protein
MRYLILILIAGCSSNPRKTDAVDSHRNIVLGSSPDRQSTIARFVELDAGDEPSASTQADPSVDAAAEQAGDSTAGPDGGTEAPEGPDGAAGAASPLPVGQDAGAPSSAGVDAAAATPAAGTDREPLPRCQQEADCAAGEICRPLLGGAVCTRPCEEETDDCSAVAGVCHVALRACMLPCEGGCPPAMVCAATEEVCIHATECFEASDCPLGCCQSDGSCGIQVAGSCI